MNGPPPASFPAFDVSKSDRTDALTVVGLTVTYRMRGRDREVLQDVSFRGFRLREISCTAPRGYQTKV